MAKTNFMTTLTGDDLPDEWELCYKGTVTKREGIHQPTFASETYISDNHEGKKVVADVRGDGILRICSEQVCIHQSASYSMSKARRRLIEWITDSDDIPVATMREEDRQIAERTERL